MKPQKGVFLHLTKIFRTPPLFIDLSIFDKSKYIK